MSEYFAVIAYKVTGRFSNSEVLLLCLCYATFYYQKLSTRKLFTNSLSIPERVTGHTIKNVILAFLQRKHVNLKLTYTSMPKCNINKQ